MKISESNSMLENELANRIKQKEIASIHICEVTDGYYTYAKKTKTGNHRWYITTRRDRSHARLWKDLDRLNRHLQQLCENKECIRSEKIETFIVDGRKWRVTRGKKSKAAIKKELEIINNYLKRKSKSGQFLLHDCEEVEREIASINLL